MNLFKTVLTLTLLACGVGQAGAAGLSRFDLGGAWQVAREGSGDSIAATVPGYIHVDLLAAHKIPDPFYRANEKAVQWVGESNWIYRRAFEAPPELLAREHVLLRCEGLDTLATIRLNGAEIAHTDNMFRTYEFDVKKLLRAGSNRLEIKFDSVLPVMRAKEAQRKLPTWAYPGAAYVRKEPCNFGWDWGPTLVSCGIWRNIGLVAFDRARLEDVAILQDHSHKGKVVLSIEVATVPSTGQASGTQLSTGQASGTQTSGTQTSGTGSASGPDALQARASIHLGGQSIGVATARLHGGRANVELTIRDPQLWWPAGMGAQPLYSVAIDLLDNAGNVLDASAKRIGLRTLRAVQQTADAPMHFVVNGVPFFAKGANWIPADCFATRLTPAILRRYVQDAVAVNMNALRFWGGGYYEDDALYDLCDEMGICIWLDFKFGCTTYPAFDAAFLANVTQEARDNIRRLRHHPSIAVWCGNNEIMFFRGKDWTKDKMSAADYYKLFRDTLGGAVGELAPQADYVTGSPDCGDVHYWEVWHGGKPFEFYRRIHGFVSEFGFQSFPEPKTVATFTAAEDRQSVYSTVMKYHERSNRMYMDVKEDGTIGTGKIMKLVKQYFRDPKDFDSTLWLSQITQGYGIKYGAEGWRREMPKSMGCVYWQYNDCWPCSSWASVDYFGRWKALHYMAQRFYAPLLVSGAEDAAAGRVDVYVTSDRMQPCQGRLAWKVTDPAGEPIAEGHLDLAVPARSSRMAHALPLADQIRKHGVENLLVWLRLDVGGQAVSQNLVTFVYPRKLELVDPQLKASVTQTGEQFVVTLTAARPALWAWLELEAVDARFSQNFVHVTRESPVEIRVTPAQAIGLDGLRKALRVRSLYDTYAH
jgi:beta-mannosidase